MNWRDWYDALEKPTWTPEPSTIGLIWKILYPIILITLGYASYRVTRKQFPWLVSIPFSPSQKYFAESQLKLLQQWWDNWPRKSYR